MVNYASGQDAYPERADRVEGSLFQFGHAARQVCPSASSGEA